MLHAVFVRIPDGALQELQAERLVNALYAAIFQIGHADPRRIQHQIPVEEQKQRDTVQSAD